MNQLEQKLEQDLKTALLASKRVEVEALRTLKSALLNAKIEQGKRTEGLSDDEVIAILSKEAKKRQESADLYMQGGNPARAEAELSEKKLIERYLPSQLSTEELSKIVDETIAELGVSGSQAMGQVIGVVRQKTAGAADGAAIAQLVKERLSQ
ncbi:MAG TPA: GatB/YqeY domain-containing protein [Candidatus Saccharimonadales bacterium]|nr:GatB/YqeY domain-containing protein [Candidatus Saccharimonadales bacterium]